MKLTTRTGKIVGAGMVDNDHTLMLMSTSGKVIRLPVSQVPTIGRQTQGVTLMKLDPDETVATMTIAEKKEDEADPSLPPLNGHDETEAVPARRSASNGD
jgi:DNA gyrase subunit A